MYDNEIIGQDIAEKKVINENELSSDAAEK